MYQEAIELIIELSRNHNLLSIAIRDNGEIVVARRGLGIEVFDSAIQLLEYLES